MTECASSNNPARCRVKTAAMKIGYLLAVGVGFTALLGGGLTVLTGN